MIGYCPSTGPAASGHVIYFRFRPILQHCASQPLACVYTHTHMYIYYIYIFYIYFVCIYKTRVSLSFYFFFFLRSLHGHARRPRPSRAVRFGIDAAADTGIKKNRTGNCVHAGASDSTVWPIYCSDRGRLARCVPFLRFSPALVRFRTLSPNVIRDLRHDGRVDSIGQKTTLWCIETHLWELKLKTESV